MGKSAKGGSKAKGDGLVPVDPSIVRFTHARIRPFFSGCGRRVEDTLSDVVEGRLAIGSLPNITVILIGGNYFSLNNRRLFVLKALRATDKLPDNTIPVRIRAPNAKELVKYTVERCSLNATIMKEFKGSSNGEDNLDDAGEDNLDDAGDD